MGRIQILAAPGGREQLRQALVGLVESHDQFDVDWAESITACQERFAAVDPDCLVISGVAESAEFDILDTISTAVDPFPVFVATTDPDRASRALLAGATGYLDSTALESAALLGTRIETAVEQAREQADRTHTLRKYDTFLDVIPDTVVTTDLDGQITGVYGNQGWSGYSEDEWVGEHFGLCLPPEIVERVEQMTIDLIEQNDSTTKTYEADITTKSEETVPHEVHLSLLPPDQNGHIPGTISVLRDITEQKDQQAQLQRQNDRLERFSSVISHDLRNPLNVASARLELAAEECNSEHLGHIRRAHDRMERLIEDLLELARAQDFSLSVEPISLPALVQDCWQHVDTDEGALDIETDQEVRADESRLKQLIENLVRNSIEHSESATTVTVGALPDGFYIEDDGEGIPKSERESIFESGYSTAEEGTGFGLSIVTQVVEDHGWTIRATDNPDGGARFEITGIDTE